MHLWKCIQTMTMQLCIQNPRDIIQCFKCPFIAILRGTIDYDNKKKNEIIISRFLKVKNTENL